MNKQELIGKLQMVYIGDKNALNEMVGYYDGLKESIEHLKQENKKQKKYLMKYITIVNQELMCVKVYSQMTNGNAVLLN